MIGREVGVVMGFVVREDVNGKRFYDHELTKVINPDSLTQVRGNSDKAQGMTGNRTNQGSVINILREKLGVNDGTARTQGNLG